MGVRGIQKGRNPSVKESSIANGGYHRCFDSSIFEPLGQADTRSHGDFRPARFKRLIHPEDCTANVPGNDHLFFLVPEFFDRLIEREVGAPVGTTRTEGVQPFDFEALGLLREIRPGLGL